MLNNNTNNNNNNNNSNNNNDTHTIIKGRRPRNQTILVNNNNDDKKIENVDMKNNYCENCMELKQNGNSINMGLTTSTNTKCNTCNSQLNNENSNSSNSSCTNLNNLNTNQTVNSINNTNNSNSNNNNHEQDKTSLKRTYELRTRNNKEPEVIDLMSSDDELNNSCKKLNESCSNNSKREINANKSATEVSTVFNNKKKINERPWNIELNDVDQYDLELDEEMLKSNDFEFDNELEFIRFGTIQFNSGKLTFQTNRGIIVSSSSNDEQFTITLGKEDIKYCAAHFSKKVKVFFIRVNDYFSKLFGEMCQHMMNGNEHGFDVNSPNPKFQRIIIILKRASRSFRSYLASYFYRVNKTQETPCFLEFIKLEKAKELLISSFGVDSKYLLLKGLLLNDNEILVKYQPNDEDQATITASDVICLNEGEFLNDNIISFYLKYLRNEVFSDIDKNRTIIFDTFFYNRLTQKETRRNKEHSEMSAAQQRHSRVKTWTKGINIFEKDFIIVPINKNVHWYLAVICYPSLLAPVYGNEKRKEPTNEEPANDITTNNNNNNSNNIKTDLTINFDKLNRDAQSGLTFFKNKLFDDDSLSNDKKDEIILDNKNQASNNNELNIEEESLDEAESVNEEANIESTNDRVCIKMPSILIFDSLPNAKGWKVVATLREYLQCEWNIKHPNEKREFTKDTFIGICASIPTQNNYFDCGIYLLQYVESLFKNPIKDFNPPIILKNWFTQDVIKTKRNKILNIISDLRKKCAITPTTTATATTTTTTKEEEKSDENYQVNKKRARLSSTDTTTNINNNNNLNSSNNTIEDRKKLTIKIVNDIKNL